MLMERKSEQLLCFHQKHYKLDSTNLASLEVSIKILDREFFTLWEITDSEVLCLKLISPDYE